jgi:hypothetical protein
MGTQINLRLSDTMLANVKAHSEHYGFDSVQEFIKEIVRQKIYEDITPQELILVNKLAEATETKNLFGTEKQLFQKLRKKHK